MLLTTWFFRRLLLHSGQNCWRAPRYSRTHKVGAIEKFNIPGETQVCISRASQGQKPSVLAPYA